MAEDLFVIREGKCDDLGDVHEMMNELFRFQHLNCHPMPLEVLKSDSGLLDGQSNKYFHLLVAEEKSSGQLVGYAIYYFWLKTSLGKILYLEDLYIRESARRHKLGLALMKRVAQVADQVKAVKIKLHVLDWNPARKFYENLGAKYHGVVYNGWLEYDMDSEVTSKLAHH